MRGVRDYVVASVDAKISRLVSAESEPKTQQTAPDLRHGPGGLSESG